MTEPDHSNFKMPEQSIRLVRHISEYGTGRFMANAAPKERQHNFVANKAGIIEGGAEGGGAIDSAGGAENVERKREFNEMMTTKRTERKDIENLFA